MKVQRFKAKIEIIGINPFVFVPEKVLETIFRQSGKETGHIPVCGSVNEIPYRQTLVRYLGHWRLYINTKMLKNSPQRIGEQIAITICHDPEDRSIPAHPSFTKALNEDKTAAAVFDNLTPSLKKEIVQYITNLKTEESVDRNIQLAIGFLRGKNRFVGRDKP